MHKIYSFVSCQLGIDPRRTIRTLAGAPRFVADWFRFRGMYPGRMNLFPCLQDRFEEGGTTKGEYFLQDLYVARRIHDCNPVKHVDIGSRIDGFVAHVASFREIEVIDIRPVSTEIPGVIFRQIDLVNSSVVPDEYCDSLSCLHALEHFGLGRYGDMLDPDGHWKGLFNLGIMLKKNGILYLSVPVGSERVEFNGHRIMNPMKIVDKAEACGLRLSAIAYIGDDGILRQCMDDDELTSLAKRPYTLGIFTFVKK